MVMTFLLKKEADKQEKNLLKLWDHFLDFIYYLHKNKISKRYNHKYLV